MTVIEHRTLAAQTGTAFVIRRGQRLRIIDPRGEQVSDLISFAADDHEEWLSSGRTIDYANTIYLTTGHSLYSNRRPADVDCRRGHRWERHDFLLTPCSPETFTIIYKTTSHHPSCFENLWRNRQRTVRHPRPTRFRRRSTCS